MSTEERIAELLYRKLCPPGRILGEKNFANIGRSGILHPANATAADILINGNTIIRTRFPDSTITTGTGISRTERVISGAIIPKIPAEAQYDGITLGMAVDACPVGTNFGDGEVVQLQMQAKWETGSAMMGEEQERATPFVNGIDFRNEIIFDIQHGVILSLPGATSLQLNWRYVATKLSSSFAAGDVLGPDYRVNFALSYGQAEPDALTFTDAPINLDAAEGNEGFFVKPKFADAVAFTWSEFLTVGPLRVRFVGSHSANVIWEFEYDPSTLGPVPFFFPWPNGAMGVRITNTDAANPMTFVTLTHSLSL